MPPKNQVPTANIPAAAAAKLEIVPTPVRVVTALRFASAARSMITSVYISTMGKCTRMGWIC